MYSYQFQWIPHISDTIWHVASIVRYLGVMQILEGRLMRNLPFLFPIQSNRSGVSMLIHDICMGREVIDTITQCSYGIDWQIIINSDFLGRFVCAWYWNWNNDFIYFKEHTAFCDDWLLCQYTFIFWTYLKKTISKQAIW